MSKPLGKLVKFDGCVTSNLTLKSTSRLTFGSRASGETAKKSIGAAISKCEGLSLKYKIRNHRIGIRNGGRGMIAMKHLIVNRI